MLVFAIVVKTVYWLFVADKSLTPIIWNEKRLESLFKKEIPHGSKIQTHT